MAEIVMVGSGVVGMCGAILLARDGHQVTVLERDPAEPPKDPDEAWEQWERRGVNQFRMIHLLLARFRQDIDRELPEVVEALDKFGALRINPIDELPLELTKGHRDDDDRFEIITARRPVIEAAVASVAQSTPGLTIRRGVAAAGLITADAVTGHVPHICGVALADGERVLGDLVIDAGGRRSALVRWLDDLGVTVHEDADDSGFVYYGRHFRSRDGSLPDGAGVHLLHQFESMSLLTLPCDRGTWGVAIIASASDKALRAASDTDHWERVVRSFPTVAHWIDGEPIVEGVQIMTKIEDRVRQLVIDGQPIATGIVALGDAWACTNPSVGRGISLGMMHAITLRDTVASVGTSDAAGLALAFHQAGERDVAPYVQDTLRLDGHRLSEIQAQIEGRSYETDDPGFHLGLALRNGASKDPELLRGYLEAALVLSRGVDVLSRPGMAERAIELGVDESVPEGPTRTELLTLLA